VLAFARKNSFVFFSIILPYTNHIAFKNTKHVQKHPSKMRKSSEFFPISKKINVFIKAIMV